MTRSTKLRKGRTGKGCSTPPDVLGFPIPDPAGWSSAIREWYRDATAEWAAGPSDIFIFQVGTACHILLQDAISVVGLVGALRIDESEWVTENGYPEFLFDSGRLTEVTGVLERARYNVKVLTPMEGYDLEIPHPWGPTPAGATRRGLVIDIGTGRALRR